MTKILRRHEAAFPDAPEVGLRAGLVFREASFAGRVGVQRKPLADQQLVQADGFALDGANADMPFAVGFVRPQIFAANTALADQARQLVPRFYTAGPWLRVVVDADLVELRSVDTIEPVCHTGKLDGVAIPHGGICGPARACGKKQK